MTQFTTRAYNSIELNTIFGTLIKSSDTDRLRDEIEYYKNIPDALKSLFPRILSSGYDNITHRWSMVMDYYAGYKSLGDYVTDGQLKREDWVAIARKLGRILGQFSTYHPWEQGTFIGGKVERTRMFIDKTISEYDNLGKFPELKRLIESKEIIINGAKYDNFRMIWPGIKETIDKRLINGTPFSFIHGDFCFSNILCGWTREGEPLFRFIDPRGSFGINGIYGDPIYDYAKLRHSYEGGYEFIINNYFTKDHEGNNIQFRLSLPDYRAMVKDVFHNELFGAYQQSVNSVNAMLVEGLIYIGMVARHYDSLDRQKVMYATGVQILNDIMAYL